MGVTPPVLVSWDLGANESIVRILIISCQTSPTNMPGLLVNKCTLNERVSDKEPTVTDGL
jgi:hypothetical protein